MKLYGNFFPSNAFLRRRRKKALLRVNDRGGGWKMCILAYVVCTCVRACALPLLSLMTKLFLIRVKSKNAALHDNKITFM